MTPSTNSLIRVGVLGGALNSAVGRAHIAALRLDGRFDIVAGCFSRDATKNSASFSEYHLHGAKICANSEELFEYCSSRADAVILLTPTDQHAQQVSRALDIGNTVICEKALAVSVGEALTISRHPCAGRVAVIGNYTGYTMFRELCARITGGYIGDIIGYTAEMPQETYLKVSETGSFVPPQPWRRTDPEIPMVSLDLGVHLHMLVNRFNIGLPTSVVALQDSFGNWADVTDEIKALAVHATGAHGFYWYGKAALGFRNGLRLQVMGSQGALEWRQTQPDQIRVVTPSSQIRQVDTGDTDLILAPEKRFDRFKPGHATGFVEALANYYLELEPWLADRQVEASDFENIVGIRQALDGLQLLHSISESARLRCWVSVPL